MFPLWRWVELTLPPRHFSWRVRGNALHWSMTERDRLEGGYDLLVATSMVDLATLRGLVPALAQIPTIVYFHENQFVYPQDRQRHNLLEAQMTSLYSALAADRVLFNSQYNQSTFFEGCQALLDRLPDYVPPAVVASLQQKSSVLPVPVDPVDSATISSQWPKKQSKTAARPLRLIWVGRFEHDKGAGGLRRILCRLEDAGLDYELAITGQQFRTSPEVFGEIQTSYAHRLVQFGYIESADDYRALLQGADIVLSTALHEFQGLAVLQAVARGCLPVVPERLVYPEIYPATFCYESLPENPDEEAASAMELIAKLAENLEEHTVVPPDVSMFEAEHLVGLYERVFTRTAALYDSQ
jgi:glycosyltransferase involved in cell wall biosynthesis